MSWSFKFVGDVPSLLHAMDTGGGQFNSASGRLEVPESYTRACREIVNHLASQPRETEIGWQIEAWSGGPTYHIDIQPVNLRVGFKP